MSDRLTLREDLLVYANAFAYGDDNTNAFFTTFERLGEPEFGVAVAEFFMIVQHMGSDDARLAHALELLEEFVRLTDPHVPELLPFSHLALAVLRPDSMPDLHPTAQLIQAMLAGRLDEVKRLAAETSCIFGLAAITVTMFATVPGGARVLQSAAEPLGSCNCVPGRVSLNTWFRSNGMRTLEAGTLSDQLRSVESGVWSTLPADGPNWHEAGASQDHFTFRVMDLDEGGYPVKFFMAEFGAGGVHVVHTHRADLPPVSADAWFAHWNHHASAFNELIWRIHRRTPEHPRPENAVPRYEMRWTYTERGQEYPGKYGEILVEMAVDNTLWLFDHARGDYQKTEVPGFDLAAQILFEQLGRPKGAAR